jgi:hypothetical protein
MIPVEYERNTSVSPHDTDSMLVGEKAFAHCTYCDAQLTGFYVKVTKLPFSSMTRRCHILDSVTEMYWEENRHSGT